MVTIDEDLEIGKAFEAEDIPLELPDEAWRGMVRPHRLLKREEERELFARLRAGDETARVTLVEHNQLLVASVANRYSHPKLSTEDFFQEGNLGLLRAIEKFEPGRGLKFSTYAVNWIRQACSRAIEDQGRTIRLPVHLGEELRKLKKIQEVLQDRHGREPSSAELAAATGYTETKVIRLLDVIADVASLDEDFSDDLDGSRSLYNVIPDTTDVAEAACNRIVVGDLLRLVDRLPERERQVLELRYGLADGEALTLEKVGQVLGVTRERVRQVETMALNKLRAMEPVRMLLAGSV